MDFKKNEAKPVFAISAARTDREGRIVQKEGEAKWREVGAAFLNSDDTINIYLEAAPISGKLQIRNPLPKRNVSGQEMEDAR